MHPMFQVSINFCNQLFTQLWLENPRSHIVVLAKPKLQLVPSPSCVVKLHELLEFGSIRSTAKIGVQLCFYFTNCHHCILRHAIFGDSGLHYDEGWNFMKYPQKKKTSFLNSKMAFYRCWRLQYWTPGKSVLRYIYITEPRSSHHSTQIW